tara:strand:- start:1658 stop:1789 length:132 start_codon:yes stop_codon:yes gene_type:complete
MNFILFAPLNSFEKEEDFISRKMSNKKVLLYIIRDLVISGKRQ